MCENKDLKNIFAENLKYYARKNNVIQADIARALNISTSLISDWFTGKKMPRVDNVEKLADYFGVSSSDLYSKDIFHQADNVINSLENMIIGGKTLKEHNVNNILDELYDLDLKDLYYILGQLELLIKIKEKKTTQNE